MAATVALYARPNSSEDSNAPGAHGRQGAVERLAVSVASQAPTASSVHPRAEQHVSRVDRWRTRPVHPRPIVVVQHSAVGGNPGTRVDSFVRPESAQRVAAHRDRPTTLSGSLANLWQATTLRESREPSVLVGATGFEPVTSSVSANGGEALCYASFSQVAANRRSIVLRSLPLS
jgi:hypothetical protein